MSLFEGAAVSARLRPGVDSVRSLARSAIALGLSILVFFPVLPSMPTPLLDSSWRMAFNEAWASGIHFAQGMVFTYGPYAFLSTQQYQPDTYPVLVACSLLLSMVLFLLLRYIGLGSKGAFHSHSVLLCLIASGYTSSPDVRFICYVFLFLVAAGAQPPSEAEEGGRSLLRRSPVVLNLAAFSFGLICLVKATFTVEISVVLGLAMVALYMTGRRLLAPAILVSFAFGLILFWLAAHQPLAEVPGFFLNQAQVAAGYGQAMGGGDDLLPPALFIASAMPLAIAVKRDLQAPTASKYLVAGGMAVTLFLAFKEGFVREDDWHVMIAAEVLLILPWCWPSERVCIWRKAQAVVAGITVLVCALTFPHALDLQAKAATVDQLLHCSDNGPLVCPTRTGWLRRTYELSLARLRAGMPLPKIQGTVDVYTVDQYLAIANGYHWDPRPVMQSYSAYTPGLARINAGHLTGAAAPDGVLFSLQPIDGRLPTFEDGLSWPILLTQYGVNWLGIPSQPSGGVAIAYLRRKPDFGRISVSSTPLLRGTLQLMQKVDLPQSGNALLAEIDIRPTAYGRFEELLLRGSQLYINLLFADGHVEHYRFIPGIARAGFILSPVITNTVQFTALRDLIVRPQLSARRPMAFWLSGSPSALLMWTHADLRISGLQELHH